MAVPLRPTVTRPGTRHRDFVNLHVVTAPRPREANSRENRDFLVCIPTSPTFPERGEDSAEPWARVAATEVASCAPRRARVPGCGSGHACVHQQPRSARPSADPTPLPVRKLTSLRGGDRQGQEGRGAAEPGQKGRGCTRVRSPGPEHRVRPVTPFGERWPGEEGGERREEAVNGKEEINARGVARSGVGDAGNV